MSLYSLDSGRELLLPDSFAADIPHTVCITGHREKSIPDYKGDPQYHDLTVAAVKLMLYRYLDHLFNLGYTDFISGLATGTDLWAAEHILKKRDSGRNVRLIGAMPYLRHSQYFSVSDRELLRKAERSADVLLTVCADPQMTYGKPFGGAKRSMSLYRDRNCFMVDNASAVAAFLNRNGAASGTAQTVNYANRRGRLICRFGTEDVFSVIDSAGTDIRRISNEIQLIPSDEILLC